MAYDLSTLEAVFKETYLGKLVDLYREMHPLYDRLWETAQPAGGKAVSFAARLSPGHSATAGGDGGVFPLSGSPTTTNFRFNYTTFRESRKFTQDSNNDSVGNVDAFVNSMELASLDGMKGIISLLAQQIYGNRSSCLSIVKSVVIAGAGPYTITTQTYDDPTQASVSHNRGTRYLVGRSGEVDIVSPTGTVRNGANKITINSITDVEEVVFGTVADPAGWGIADGDFVVPAGAFSGTVASGGAHGLIGLDEILSDGTDIPAALYADYGGFDRSAVSHPLPSPVENYLGVAGSLSVAGIRALFNAARMASGKDFSPSQFLMCMSPEVRNLIAQFEVNQIRFTPEHAEQGVDDRFTSINLGLGAMPLMEDSKCPPRTLFGVSMDCLKILEVAPLEIVNPTGGPGLMLLARNSAGRAEDAYEMFFRARCQMAADDPRAGFKLTGIAGSPEFGVGGTPSSFLVVR